MTISVKPLELQSSALIGAPGEHQGLELRLRDGQDRKRDLQREFSPTSRTSTHSNRLISGRHGNQIHPHSTEEGTGDSEAKRAGNSSDCVRQPVVNKCEVGVMSASVVYSCAV